MEALFCLFLSKDSDSDSNWLYVWLLSHHTLSSLSSCSLFLLVLILFCTFFAILLSLLTMDFRLQKGDHKLIQLS